MEKHAVPQNIMDVEFKLFGSMTIRQFGYTAVSFIVALLLYFSPLPKLAALPIIVIIVIVGLALAFLRVNDQPFSLWLGNFVKNLFGSQRRVYHKTQKRSAVLAKVPTKATTSKATVDDDPLVRRKLQTREYLAQRELVSDVAIGPSASSELEDPLDPVRASSLDSYFSKAVGANLEKYNLKPAGESLATTERVSVNTSTIAASQGQISTQTNSTVRPLTKASQLLKTEPSLRAPGNAQPVLTAQVVRENTTVQPTPDQSMPAQQLQRQPVSEELVQAQPAQPLAEQPAPAAAPVQTAVQMAKAVPEATATPAQQEGPSSLRILRQLKPNQIAGFICDMQNAPIDKAQVMVKNERGEPLRAVYSDPNGKFIVPTVLENGNYSIEIKAGKYKFPEYQVELKGELLPLYRYLATS